MLAPAPKPDSLEARFHRVIGRAPTPAEISEWHRWQQALEIRPTDSFWSLVFVMQQQRAALAAVPNEVQEALKGVRGTLGEELGHVVGATIDNFETALGKATRAVAKDVVREAAKLAGARTAGTRLQWIAGTVALCIVALAGAVTGGYVLGNRGARGADAEFRAALAACAEQGMQRIARDGAEWCAVRVR